MTEDLSFYSLPSTAKLFHDDPYATEGSATVLAVSGNKAVLDRTIFYAESGGQIADQGEISGQRVLDVQKVGGTPYGMPGGEMLMIDTVHVHEFEEPCTLVPGQQVEMRIDWARRYHNMQMHSLAHYVYAAVGEWMETQGMARSIKGCHVAETTARFDFVGAVPGDALHEITPRTVELVKRSGEVTMTPAEGSDDVFLWRSGGITMPCGGTHVRDSSEIEGDIRLRRSKKGKNLTRVYVELERPNR
jgi:Ser-tRNA(Ala) deacylase AlaX